jgi:hypothetical protein
MHARLAAGFCLLAAPTIATAQGYHVDTYPALRQNPGGLNADTEEQPGTPYAPTGWTRILRYVNLPQVARMSKGVVLPTGFQFQFNGQPVTAIRAFEGGFVTFDTIQTAITELPIVTGLTLPAQPAPNRFAWVADMLIVASRVPAQILTKTFGTAPNRQFWVQ